MYYINCMSYYYLYNSLPIIFLVVLYLLVSKYTYLIVSVIVITIFLYIIYRGKSNRVHAESHFLSSMPRTLSKNLF